MSTCHDACTAGEVRKQVRDFVVLLAGLPDLDDDQPLISQHVLDSMSAVQMVVFVERHFGVVVEDADLELANFDTVSGLTNLVLGKLGGAKP